MVFPKIRSCYCGIFVEGSLPTNIIAGMLSGVISSSIANPTDVVKVCVYAYCVCVRACVRACVCV